ncbi:hypothetical protein V3851_17055 [Paenibacillus sp. M1]|uniref:DUF2140 family protein n=1 Tax=Paenibacillus haidiansis TaxID=1574488 RepID=A0ABU7VUW4_9BACL
MGKRRLVIGFLLLAVVLFLAAALLYIRPAENLDLQYSDISWKDKLRHMAETRKAELTLSEQELNQLAKRELNEYIAEHTLPVQITGAEFHLNGEHLTADLNLAWGALDAGVAADYRMEYTGGGLTLTPESLAVRNLSLTPDAFGLEPIVIDFGTYLPDIVEVKDMSFPGKSVKMEFALDWLEVARYLDLL